MRSVRTHPQIPLPLPTQVLEIGRCFIQGREQPAHRRQQCIARRSQPHPSPDAVEEFDLILPFEQSDLGCDAWLAEVEPLRGAAQRGRMGDAVALLPVCRSPPFAPCQQLSPYAPEISRRQLANLIMVAAALPAFSRIARAETYPSRPVRIIVGFSPGGAADVTARLIGQWLSERLGQPFIIENRPGAGTNIGTEAVAKSPADGYTLLLVSVANTVNATLYETLDFDFIRDITPVA